MKKSLSILVTLAMVMMLLPVQMVSAAGTVTVTATGGSTTVRILTTEISGISADSYEYQWYHNVDDQENGEYTPIYLATGSTYTITPSDIATWIKCEVTPITGGVRGAIITSNKYHQENAYYTWRINNGGPAASANNPGTYYVNIGGESILILDEYADSFYAITAAFHGWHTFGASSSVNTFDPTSSTNIGYYLNNDLLTTTNANKIGVGLQSHLIYKKWWVGPGDDSQRSPYSFNAKVGLLSVEEYEKYKARLGYAPYSAGGNWWLRNTRGWLAGPGIGSVSRTDGAGNVQTTAEKSLLVRPTFYLDKDLFLEQKAKVSDMGSGIKQMLVRRYKASDLAGLYSASELATIGFTDSIPTATLSPTTATALTTLTASYSAANAVSYEYKWYYSGDNTFYYQAIGQTANTYQVSNYDMNKYIRVAVTPVYADGSKGTTAVSDTVNVTALGRLSRTGYGDDRESHKGNPIERYVSIGGEPIIILDEFSDGKESFYVTSAHLKGADAFDDDNTTKFDPTDSNNIAYYLNNSFLTGGQIVSAVQSYIPTHTWWTEAGHSSSNSPEDYSADAKIGLMSRSEYEKYWGRFGWDPSTNGVAGWWLRSGRGTNGTANTVFVARGAGSGTGYNNSSSTDWANTWDKPANTSYYIRPTYYLSEDVFKKVKADVDSMGSSVKEMLVRRYNVEDLQGLYTNDELETIGFSFVDNVSHSSSTLTFDAYGLSNSQIFVATYDTDGNLTKFEKADAKNESMTVGTGFGWGKIFVWNDAYKAIQGLKRFY